MLCGMAVSRLEESKRAVRLGGRSGGRPVIWLPWEASKRVKQESWLMEAGKLTSWQ